MPISDSSHPHIPNPQSPFLLDLERLRWRCDPKQVQKLIELEKRQNSVSETPVYFTQPRALESVEMGIQIDAPGYHIFISGPTSSGKTSTIKSLLKTLRRPAYEMPYDYLYLHNFEDSDRPTLYQTPAGEGRKLKRLIQHFVERLPEMILSGLTSQRIERRRRMIQMGVEDAYQSALREFQALCQEHGFTLVFDEDDHIGSFEIEPYVKRKKSAPLEEWVALAEAGKIKKANIEETRARHQALDEELHRVWDQLSAVEWEAKRILFEDEAKEVTSNIEHNAHMLDPYYIHEEEKGILFPWVQGLMKWIEDHLEEFKSVKDELIDLKDLRILKVNLIHEAPTEHPIIFEQSPTLVNLLGTIERSGEDTHPHLDFGDIRGGSLLKANGGILVLNANDLAVESGTWRLLLKTLKNRMLEIQSPDQLFSSGGGPLKPDAIPLNVKVIAIGDDELYRILYISSDEFARVFKIKAEFDESLPNTSETLQLYISHALRVSREENLPPFSPEALGVWCEYGTRLSGHQKRLATHLGKLTDLLRESAFYSQKKQEESVSLACMKKALAAQFERHQLIEEHLFELMKNQILDLNPQGQAVGNIYGLTVMDFGDYCCGHPCRISATHTPGDAGVVSIEREVALSGRSHSKGTLTLGAYVRSHYLPHHVCALHANLTFDQVHDEVDGDSASLAETLVLLSNLADVPLLQSIAVTGAIDQQGGIQAVGGVNEKIEGFFRLCQIKGFTGNQGVIIPKANQFDLALRQEVLDAVEAGHFSIWAISHIDQALELMIEIEVGPKSLTKSLSSLSKANGYMFEESIRELQYELRFPPQTFKGQVQNRLLLLSEIAQRFHSKG